MLLTVLVFQIVLTQKAIHQTESMTLALSLQKFPRTTVIGYIQQDQPIIWREVRRDQ
jgi:hypothetical protein